ncbi:Nucleic-acid-binding protein from transposon X-element [Eumeta japonica]|uniref:Nucleic-acid-binding protein from transposon X-element n=1 Tax=Eumeta variegata TaxID=151549 RepID=A0A4C1Y1E6_EUMVA|nr:Nucleic-acid-binding protein from transposon X-element [Eumeta japonica]
MDVEFNSVKEPSKRPAAVRPSEDSTSDSDPGWSNVSDHSNFTTVRSRKTSRTKPEASFLTQATDGSTYFRLTAASQGAVETGKSNKGAAPAAAKNSNNKSDEADVTAPPFPAPRGKEPPPVFVQNMDRWTELRKKYADKNIQITQALTQSYAIRTYSLKEEREIRVVLREVPREIPVDEVKEDLRARNLSVQSVRQLIEPLPRAPRPSFGLRHNDKATKAAFFQIRSVCSLSGIKAEQLRKRALPGQCHNCQSYGHSSRHCFDSARCVKCLGNHGTVQ